VEGREGGCSRSRWWRWSRRWSKEQGGSLAREGIDVSIAWSENNFFGE
jgi:hypothetical protein